MPLFNPLHAQYLILTRFLCSFSPAFVAKYGVCFSEPAQWQFSCSCFSWSTDFLCGNKTGFCCQKRVGKLSCSQVAMCCGLASKSRAGTIKVSSISDQTNAPKGFIVSSLSLGKRLLQCPGGLLLHWKRCSIVRSLRDVRGMGGDVMKWLGLRVALPCDLRGSCLPSLAVAVEAPCH